jgi:hypothetical protein
MNHIRTVDRRRFESTVLTVALLRRSPAGGLSAPARAVHHDHPGRRRREGHPPVPAPPLRAGEDRDVNRPKPSAVTCRRQSPPRPGQAADRRWKPDSSTVRPHSPAGTALPAACTHCRPDPTSRRSGSPAAPAPPAVDTRWRPDPTTARSGNRAVAPSRLPRLPATGRRLAQEQPSGLSNAE